MNKEIAERIAHGKDYTFAEVRQVANHALVLQVELDEARRLGVTEARNAVANISQVMDERDGARLLAAEYKELKQENMHLRRALWRLVDTLSDGRDCYTLFELHGPLTLARKVLGDA